MDLSGGGTERAATRLLLGVTARASNDRLKPEPGYFKPRPRFSGAPGRLSTMPGRARAVNQEKEARHELAIRTNSGA